MPLCELCKKNQAVIYTTRLEQGQPVYQGLCLSCVYKHGYIKYGGLEEMMARFGVNEHNVEEVTAQLNNFITSMGDQSPEELMQTLMQGGMSEELEDVMQKLVGQFSADDIEIQEYSLEEEGDEPSDPIDDFIDDYLSHSDASDDEDEPGEEFGSSDLVMIGFDELKEDDLDDDEYSDDANLSDDLDDSDDEDDSDEDEEDFDDEDFSTEGYSVEFDVDSLEGDGSELDEALKRAFEKIYDSIGSDSDAENEESDDELRDKSETESGKTSAKEKETPPNFSELIISPEEKRSMAEGHRAFRAEDLPDRMGRNRDRRRTRRSDQQQDKRLRHLRQYARNLNESYKAGEIDPLIGRQDELRRVVQILNRRSKNNPVLLGEPGVGKTAIAEGLAGRIVNGEVPAKLLGMELYLLDLTAMVAGTQFRGQFESRMKAVVDDAMEAENVILVIDELQNIMGAGDAEGAMNAANILKPALAKGEIRVLGSTTLDEYRRFIEKDHALERRFQQVIVEEPTREQAIEILKGNRDYYQAHHYVIYPDAVITACVDLAIRYINDRFLPDKAIDIMDEAGSLANLQNDKLVSVVKLREEVERASNILERLQERSPEEGQEERFYELQAETRAEFLQAQEAYQDVQKDLIPSEIKFSDVASVVEIWTGIPVSQVTQSESERLMNLEEAIHKRLVGQEKAVNALARAIRRNRAGLRQQKKPASFIFVGPTGVGKTEMVKALAEAMFDQEDAYIRLDMSEYMESHTVSKLIGSPPGYVGYDDGGQLTEKVRRRPYSIILLDEIEKAHADVYNILLQILDDGRLTDSHGRMVDFSNTIVVMTSNAGTTTKTQGMGFGQDGQIDLEERVHTVLKDLFRPEFLNRIDETIVFHHLSKDEIRAIVDLMLQEVQQGLAERSLRLKVNTEVKDLLAEEGYDPAYGARPLRRTITRRIEDPLTDHLLRGDLEGKSVVEVVRGEGKDEQSRQKIDFIFHDAQETAD